MGREGSECRLSRGDVGKQRKIWVDAKNFGSGKMAVQGKMGRKSRNSGVFEQKSLEMPPLRN